MFRNYTWHTKCKHLCHPQEDRTTAIQFSKEICCGKAPKELCSRCWADWFDLFMPAHLQPTLGIRYKTFLSAVSLTFLLGNLPILNGKVSLETFWTSHWIPTPQSLSRSLPSMFEKFGCQVCRQILLVSFAFYIQCEVEMEIENKNISLTLPCIKPCFSQGLEVKVLPIILNIRVPQQCTVSILKERTPGF